MEYANEASDDGEERKSGLRRRPNNERSEWLRSGHNDRSSRGEAGMNGGNQNEQRQADVDRGGSQPMIEITG